MHTVREYLECSDFCKHNCYCIPSKSWGSERFFAQEQSCLPMAEYYGYNESITVLDLIDGFSHFCLPAGLLANRLLADAEI